MQFILYIGLFLDRRCTGIAVKNNPGAANSKMGVGAG